MTDTTGDRLNAALDGRYAIERELGEGGMATVYLARDLKHNRNVALKVLKPELAALVGAERFLAEIETTANLQHPHILPLFDSGEADTFVFYVMPYVEGESLRDRLDREKQMGVKDAVAITQKVAGALDYAHGNGVVHRDIKPGNILLSAQGEPLVADFGIALAVAQAGAGRITETGLSLGTPHYMSPEQATGDRDVDPRSDVFALGCVLYEMLAGQPPFAAPTAQAVLVQILTTDAPSITAVRRTVPPNVAAALAKALEKLPADRFTTATELATALGDESFTYEARPRTTAATPRQEPVAAPEPVPSPTRPTGVPVWLTAVLGGVFLAGGYTVAQFTQQDPRPAPSAEFVIVPDTSHRVVAPCCGRAVAIAAAGDRLVYQGNDGSGVRLYQRPLNQREAQPIPGTEGGRHPFFAPDGEWLGFYSGSDILRVRFDGGTPLTVVTGEGRIWGAAWGPDNSIVYANAGDARLYRVSADGGDPVAITVVDTAGGEQRHRWPHVLPDGETVVFGVQVIQDDGTMVEMLAASPLEGGGHRLLGPGADPRYVEPGFLVHSDGASSIMAQAIDPQTLDFTGSRFRIAERVTYRGGNGLSEYDVSANGTIIYREQQGGAASAFGFSLDIVLVDMDGNEEVVVGGDAFRHARFSPDGRYIAYEIQGQPGDIWVWDLERSNPIRVTFDEAGSFPVWGADGSTSVFFTTANRIMTRSSDGSGESRLVHEDVSLSRPQVSPDGRWLLWMSIGEGRDFWIRPLDGSAEARPLVQTSFNEGSPAVSPDGRWIAYVSDDSGEKAIYVEPFPDLGRRFKLTTGGAQGPVWAPDGSRLYYRQYNGGQQDLTFVDVREGDQFDYGAPTVLFSESWGRPNGFAIYDIDPDGSRFVVVRGAGQAGATGGNRNVVITNALGVGSP